MPQVVRALFQRLRCASCSGCTVGRLAEAKWLQSGLRSSDLEVDAGVAQCWVRVSDAPGRTCAVSRLECILVLINRTIARRASCTAWLLGVLVFGLTGPGVLVA